ncbi:MAG: type I glutamate--ammonia ligase, partial [Thermoprotei archaeon]
KGDYQKRVEFRPPDPSANPYLALTATIAAGLDGIRKKIDPGDPVDKNVYHLSDRERRTLGIRELPRDLIEAIEELESDNEYLKPYFSSELIDTFVELKRGEARRLLSYPSPIEYKEYFNI